MTEKEGKRYLDEEGEGWEDGMEDFVLTMQQYSTLYSHGIKRGSVIWLQERVCVCVCVCVYVWAWYRQTQPLICEEEVMVS